MSNPDLTPDFITKAVQAERLANEAGAKMSPAKFAPIRAAMEAGNSDLVIKLLS